MNTGLTMIAAKKNQSGIVLIIGLIMLLLLTIIAITAMRVTSLEERMAGNLQNQNIAFQAAESALRDAEGYIDVQARTADSAFNPFRLTNGPFQASGDVICVSGLCGTTYPLQSDQMSLVAVDSMLTTTTNIDSIYAEPKYIIELISIEPVGGLGEQYRSVVFRITARAQGGDPNSFAELQSTYRQTLLIAN